MTTLVFLLFIIWSLLIVKLLIFPYTCRFHKVVQKSAQVSWCCFWRSDLLFKSQRHVSICTSRSKAPPQGKFKLGEFFSSLALFCFMLFVSSKLSLISPFEYLKLAYTILRLQHKIYFKEIVYQGSTEQDAIASSLIATVKKIINGLSFNP